MRGGTDVFVLFPSENVNGYQVDFGVAVFASFAGGHVDDAARASFDDDMAVFAQRRALHRVDQGSIGSGVEFIGFF